MNKEKFDVAGATVDFYRYNQDGYTIYEFDTSKSGPPEPMVNAMAGLQLLDKDSKLSMINHKAPGGLFPKVEQEFDYEINQLDDGRVQVLFSKKVGSANTTDFSANSCGG
ncbi:MAG: hypothetical protein B1H07_04655 [Campylobacteraceae bacterium 4484_166]|nr:MAG: hypothetical protein B1H07_04655 [Campylobacteraceae bacterium 4484_166]